MPTIRVPGPLRALTAGAAEIAVTARTVRAALVELEGNHPGIAGRVLDAAGAVRPFIRIYVGAEDIEALGGLDTALAEGDEVAIIPAIAGGLHA